MCRCQSPLSEAGNQATNEEIPAEAREGADPPSIWGRMNTSLSGTMGSRRASWSISPSMATAAQRVLRGGSRGRVELAELLLDGRRRELELGDAVRQSREVADQDDPRHALIGPWLWRPSPSAP